MFEIYCFRLLQYITRTFNETRKLNFQSQTISSTRELLVEFDPSSSNT